MVVLVHGPRGVGKSTLIRALVKHYTHQSLGEVGVRIMEVAGYLHIFWQAWLSRRVFWTILKEPRCSHTHLLTFALALSCLRLQAIGHQPAAASSGISSHICRERAGRTYVMIVQQVRGPITIVAGKRRRLTFVECPQVGS